MRSRIFCFLLGFSVMQAFTQQLHHADAASLALSGTDICYSGSWYGNRNPSVLPLLKFSSVGINYLNRYLVPELGSHSVYGNLQFHGSWGYSINYFGTGAFNESSISVSYGRNIFKWLDAGITMRGHRLAAEALSEQSYSITGDLGLIAKPAEGILMGLHLVNPNRSGYINSGGDIIPAEITVGIAYDKVKDFYIAAQLHWQDYSDLSVSFGSEYWIAKFLAVRAGLTVGSVLHYSYGLAFDFRKITFSIGFEQHTYLGLSSALTLTYNYSSNDNKD